MKRHMHLLMVLSILLIEAWYGSPAVLATAETTSADWSIVTNFAESQIGTLPDGWFASRGEPSICVEETSNRPALRIRPRSGASENAWDAAFVLFPEVTDRVLVEFSAYTPDIFRSLAVNVGYQADPSVEGEYGAYLTVHDNAKLTYYVEGSGWFDLSGVDLAQWNHYKMDVNLATQTFEVYVNDMANPVGTGVMRNTLGRVNQLEFSTWGRETVVPMWIGSVRIYPQP